MHLFNPYLRKLPFLHKPISAVLLAVSWCPAAWLAPVMLVKETEAQRGGTLAQSYIDTKERAGTPQSSVQF